MNNHWSIYVLKHCTPPFRYIDPRDDPFKSCFGCEDTLRRKEDDEPIFQFPFERQAGEVFQATSQSRRVVCGRGPDGNIRCRLRIDRAMQLRMVSYGRALQFIQSEQYLGEDDVSIVKY